jgi:hypothetical protein
MPVTTKPPVGEVTLLEVTCVGNALAEVICVAVTADVICVAVTALRDVAVTVRVLTVVAPSYMKFELYFWGVHRWHSQQQPH